VFLRKFQIADSTTQIISSI
jgi:Ca2+-binding EF-hand superfamily protein